MPSGLGPGLRYNIPVHEAPVIQIPLEKHQPSQREKSSLVDTCQRSRVPSEMDSPCLNVSTDTKTQKREFSGPTQ
jgi:hypothetical protein